MKGRHVAFVGVFCIVSLMVSGVHAKKPDNPGGPKIEEIAFVGDLVGDQLVEGCCPNAGPFPAYSMTLSGGLSEWAGTHDGHLFMNGSSGTNVKGKKPQEYKVQFWTDDIFFEIVGGEITYDKKSKILTVRFMNEPGCVIPIGGSPEPEEIPVIVSFVLTRTPL